MFLSLKAVSWFPCVWCCFHVAAGGAGDQTSRQIEREPQCSAPQWHQRPQLHWPDKKFDCRPSQTASNHDSIAFPRPHPTDLSRLAYPTRKEGLIDFSPQDDKRTKYVRSVSGNEPAVRRSSVEDPLAPVTLPEAQTQITSPSCGQRRGYVGFGACEERTDAGGVGEVEG